MKSILILLFVIITISITAQHSYIPSERTYTTKEGLSSDKILSLHKDSQGFIWIGTENGVNRFDGYTFVKYSKEAQSEISVNRVQQIFEDKAGYLWFIKANEVHEHLYDSPEINLYQPQTGKWQTIEERFEELPFEIKNIKYATQLEDGRLFFFILKKHKGYFYDIENGFVSIEIPKEITRLTDAKIENSQLWLEAFSPVRFNKSHWLKYQIDEDGELISKTTSCLKIETVSNGKSSSAIFEGTTYVGSRNLDAFRFFGSTVEPIFYQNSPASQRINQSVWNKNQELLWIKNQTSIRAINEDGEVLYEKAENFNFEETPFLFDGTSTWIGSPQNGLIRIQLQPNYFQVHQFFDLETDNSARGIYAYQDGRLWTATIHGNAYKNQTGQVTTSQHINASFSSFYKSKSNHLWYLHKGKIEKENLSTGQKVHYDYKKWGDNWCFFEAKDGNIWSFDGYGDRFVLNPQTGKIHKQPTFQKDKKRNIQVYSAEQVTENEIWLCTSRGLYVIDNQGNFVALYNSEQRGEYYLPTNNIHHFYEDSESVIWLATGDNGLVQWNKNTKQESHETIKLFTTENGLPCNTLHAIYEDDNDYLWISTNDGLVQFDKLTAKVATYTTENGLLHNEFNRISHFQGEDGTLYFGGLSGVMSFHPKHFKNVRKERNIANLNITKFRQFSGKKEQFLDLTHQLSQSSTITLEPTDRFFSLQIALLNFENGTTYQYRIKDIHDWQQTDGRTISVSGLPYGKHVLEIKAFNKNQQEVANTLAYSIQVLRPFYLKWWFVLLILSALGVSVFYFIKWRTQQMLVLQETTQLRELDKMKSQFFANISHELRTPITLILAPLTQILKRNYLKKEDQQQLTTVYQNGQNLLQLVNEVLDLSKLEANKLKLHLSSTKIPQFIERIAANFESAAQVKGIEIQFMSFVQKDFTAQFDQPKLEKVLNNLLSNALKFTSKQETIQVMVGAMNDELTIKIKDTGRGIPKEDLPQIFNRYFQSNNKTIEGGTGIGLALTKELIELMNGEILVQSELGEGTEFEIRLPIELVENEEIVIEQKESNLRGFENLLGFDQPEILSDNSDSSRETILLVEDNPSLQEFIHSVLAPHYNVVVANNGVEALEILNYSVKPHESSSNPDSYRDLIPNLILSDVMMPEMDGFTLLEKAKSNDKFCSIPFILLTARADMNDKLRGLRIGVDDYMTKPFEVEELLLRIKNLITNVKNRELPIVHDPLPVIENAQELNHNRQTDIASGRKTAEQLKTQNSKLKTEDLEWLEKIEHIAKREIRNPKYKVDDLAIELFISKRQLQRRLKAITGLTPNRYFRTIRLHQAKYILENEEPTTLTLVAYAVGFGNLTHFNRLFEAEFGKKPHSYLTK